ncbi:hypothetical protein AAG570_006631 [Ranatra chinensis]|uniref:Uncharacterized protein n=1 Tax=Ranatra chinensis TaxID=642074 RepID=A0ABD0YUK3_9HEMI
MRRGSLSSSGSGPGTVGVPAEPLIVVEESGGIAEEDEEALAEEELQDAGLDSPSNRDSPNPYLLSPYRDLRKRSLPTPQCTSGITASQVFHYSLKTLEMILQYCTGYKIHHFSSIL